MKTGRILPVKKPRKAVAFFGGEFI